MTEVTSDVFVTFTYIIDYLIKWMTNGEKVEKDGKINNDDINLNLTCSQC